MSSPERRGTSAAAGRATPLPNLRPSRTLASLSSFFYFDRQLAHGCGELHETFVARYAPAPRRLRIRPGRQHPAQFASFPRAACLSPAVHPVVSERNGLFGRRSSLSIGGVKVQRHGVADPRDRSAVARAFDLGITVPIAKIWARNLKMSQSAGGSSKAEPALDAASPSTGQSTYASEALRLNGVRLSQADIALTAAEFERAMEIVKPLLDFPLPDGLDQAGVYRP